MNFVIDASVAVKWFVDEDRRESARELLREGIVRSAPDIIFSEVANALRKKVASTEISKEQASRALDDIFAYLPNIITSSAILHDAFALAMQLSHPIADCLYLACARHVGGQVVSDDEKFIEKCRTRYSEFAVSLKEWVPTTTTPRIPVELLDGLVTEKLTRLAAIYEQAKLRAGRHWFEGEVVILAQRGLRDEVLNLTKDQVAHVLAACWFGALDWEERPAAVLEAAWARHLSNARNSVGGDPDNDVIYIISKLQYLDAGLRRLSSLNKTDD